MGIADFLWYIRPGFWRTVSSYRAEAGDLNEYTEVTIDHHGQPIVVRQIVGVLARRIVCRVKDGAVVAYRVNLLVTFVLE